MPLAEAVWVDPARMSGVPCFRGTRLPVQQLFDWIEDGEERGRVGARQRQPGGGGGAVADRREDRRPGGVGGADVDLAAAHPSRMRGVEWFGVVSGH